MTDELIRQFGSEIMPHDFPKAYCSDPANVKAVYLGCDPSNKHFTDLPYAFALGGREDIQKIFGRFIEGHTNNLKHIGLDWNSVYAQNLCRNYFKNETSKNLKLWMRAAEWWVPKLEQELNNLFALQIPVMLTSEVLYKVLSKPPHHKPKEFYRCEKPVPVPPSVNKLNRPLIPMYRHWVYDLSKWGKYRESAERFIFKTYL